MAFVPLRTVVKSIKKRERIVAGKPYIVYDAYLGIDPTTRKPVRMAMSNKADLEDAIRKRYKGLQGVRDIETMLTPAQTKDAIQAVLALKDAKVEISLLECARLAIASPLIADRFKAEEADTPAKPLGEAYDEYLAEFQPGTVNHKTVSSRVGKWVNAVGVSKSVSAVVESDVIDYCKQYENQKTYNNHFTYIRTFLNWCAAKRRKYIKENPLDGIKIVAPEWKRPKYLTAEQTEKLFRRLETDKENPERLAYAIVAFFCGVRAAEIERGSSAEDAVEFDIPNRTLTIIKVKRYTQGAHPRSFTIPDNALAWMKSFGFMDAWRRIHTKTADAIIREAKEAGIDYPRNGARHSFITHHYAAYESLDRTCKIAGTSAAMVKDNYSGLGNQPDGLRYFAIMPS